MSGDDENYGKDHDESIAPLLQPSKPLVAEQASSEHVIPIQDSVSKPLSTVEPSPLLQSPLRTASRYSGSEASESRLPPGGALDQEFLDTSDGAAIFPQALTMPSRSPISDDPGTPSSSAQATSSSSIEPSAHISSNTSSAQRASSSGATAGVEVNFSARLVSASGPVVGGAPGWRRAADAALSRRSRASLVSGTTGVRGTNGHVGRGAGDGQPGRVGSESRGRQLLGLRGRAARDTSRPGTSARSRRLHRPDERPNGDTDFIPVEGGPLENGEFAVARHEDEAEGQERALWGSTGEDRTTLGAIGGGDSLEPDVMSPQAQGPTPAEIRRALEQSQNTLPLLLLLVGHFVFTHVIDITAFALGTAVLAGLDRRLREHADVRDMRNMMSLVAVVVAAISTVLLSAFVLRGQPWGGELLRGLILAAPRPALHSLSDVIRAVAVVDLWARLISVAVKAFAALLASRQRPYSASLGAVDGGVVAGSGVDIRRCPGAVTRRASCRWCTRRLSSGIDRNRGRSSPCPRSRPGERAPEHELHGLMSGLRGNGRSAPGGRNVGVGATWRDRLCAGGLGGAVMCCIGAVLPCGVRRRRNWSSRWQEGDGWWGAGREERDGEGASGGDLQGEGVDGNSHGHRRVEEADDREMITTAELLGRSGRQRRIRALLEMAFLLYRTLLPVPAWLEYYGKDGDHFVAGYLGLKCVVISLRVERLARAVCYVRRGDLERGKFATPEEVAEAGSPDCSICYERMTRPLLLPCQHLFCGECVAEWLERERTCPLCRSEVPTSNPIPKALQDGRTALRPQLL